MLHVEGTILEDNLSFDVRTAERCHQIRKALQFFDINTNKSSCSKECLWCHVPENFQLNTFKNNIIK